MNFICGKLKDLWIIEPRVFDDKRGFFMETWSKREFKAHGLFYDFVQDNHSASSVKGTLRPKNSRLSKASLDAGGFMRLPGWESSLAVLLKERENGVCP